MAILLLIYTSTGSTTHGLLTTGSSNKYPQSSVTTGGSLAPFVESIEQIHLQRSKHSRPNNAFEDLSWHVKEQSFDCTIAGIFGIAPSNHP